MSERRHQRLNGQRAHIRGSGSSRDRHRGPAVNPGIALLPSPSSTTYPVASLPTYNGLKMKKSAFPSAPVGVLRACDVERRVDQVIGRPTAIELAHPEITERLKIGITECLVRFLPSLAS